MLGSCRYDDGDKVGACRNSMLDACEVGVGGTLPTATEKCCLRQKWCWTSAAMKPCSVRLKAEACGISRTMQPQRLQLDIPGEETHRWLYQLYRNAVLYKPRSFLFFLFYLIPMTGSSEPCSWVLIWVVISCFLLCSRSQSFLQLYMTIKTAADSKMQSYFWYDWWAKCWRYRRHCSGTTCHVLKL